MSCRFFWQMGRLVRVRGGSVAASRNALASPCSSIVGTALTRPTDWGNIPLRAQLVHYASTRLSAELRLPTLRFKHCDEHGNPLWSIALSLWRTSRSGSVCQGTQYTVARETSKTPGFLCPIRTRILFYTGTARPSFQGMDRPWLRISSDIE